MAVTETKERLTITIAPEVRRRLEAAVPKSERSRFVEKAVEEALRESAVAEFGKFLDTLPKATDGEDSAAFLRRKRLEWDGRPIETLEGTSE